MHREETVQAIVSLMNQRQALRRNTKRPEDKMLNSLIAIPGIPGIGKSTLLAHLFYSSSIQWYVGKWDDGLKPIVSLFTFNSAMSSSEAGVALGLRILFGALCASFGWTESWPSFCGRHFARKDMTAGNAVKLLHDTFGSDRRIFIGVDEISKIDEIRDPKMDAKKVMSDLCRVLDNDGSTDLVVSSLTPSYLKDLLTGSQRVINYVPIMPLQADDLGESFQESADLLVRQLQDELSPKIYKDFTSNPLNERILRNIYRLPSGHPRTVQFLKSSVEDGKVLQWVKVFLKITPKANPFALMKGMATMREFAMYSAEPANDEEREYLLSVSTRNVQDDPTFRVMMEKGICTIFDRDPTNELNFRISTSLPSFFKMLDTISRTDNEHLCFLSRAAKQLFGGVKSVSEMWEKSHSFSIVSAIHHYHATRRTGVSMSSLLGLEDSAFGSLLEVDSDLDVEIIQEKGAILPPWRRNVLFVAPDSQPGFDLAICMCDVDGKKCWIYKEIKVAKSDKKTTEEIMCEKIALTLPDHLQRAQLAGLPIEEKLAALSDVYFVLSRYGCELEGNMADLKEKVEAHVTKKKEENLCKLESLQGEKCTLADKEEEEEDEDEEIAKRQKQEMRLRSLNDNYEVVLAYIAEYWDSHVAFQGTREMYDSMVPVVLPLAGIVQATCEGGLNDTVDTQGR